MATQRKSNIELLRIVSMIMIVFHHIALHSNFAFSADLISVNKFWVHFIQFGGKVAVNVFVFISGYFIVTAKSLKIRNLLKLWLQIFTYSVVIFAVLAILGKQSLTPNAVLETIFPITFEKWWFATTYLVLFLLSPFINKLLVSLTKKQYFGLLILLFFCWCIIPTFLSSAFESNGLLWFIFLYALAGYIRLHIDVEKIKSGKFMLFAALAILATYLCVVAFDLLGTKFAFFAEYATSLYGMQKLTTFLISLFLFLGFVNLKIKYNPFINLISSATFGVYLLHDHPLIRTLLWETIFKNASYQNSNFLIPYTIMVGVIVFSVCTLIELFRIHVIERSYTRPLNFVSGKMDKLLEKSFLEK